MLYTVNLYKSRFYTYVNYLELLETPKISWEFLDIPNLLFYLWTCGGFTFVFVFFKGSCLLYTVVLVI